MNKKSVIVSGGSGYIGQHLVSLLCEKGYRVINIDKNPPSINVENSIYIYHNLIEPFILTKEVKKAIYFIHLAAEVGGVEFANKYPAKIIKNNSLIDINSIDLALKIKVKKFIYISSSLIYEKSKKFPLIENESKSLPLPDLSYGIEKIFGENLCFSYKEEYGLEYTILRLFNVYGKNIAGITDPNGHVIPDLIRKVASSNGRVEIWGKKGISRNFTHVNDISHGIIAALSNVKAVNEIFNLSNSKEYSLEEIVKILWKLMQKKERLKFTYLISKRKDVARNAANSLKAKRILNWSSKISLEDGLRAMI